MPLRAAPQPDAPLVATLRDGAALDALEHGYEELSAAVYERRGDWLKLRLADGGFVWLAPDPRNSFHPLADLLREGLTGFLGTAPAQLFDAPNGKALAVPAAASRAVKVLRTRGDGAGLWLEVEVLNASPCEAEGEPKALRRGWTPAFLADGRPALWFASRGC